ncbi:hypothetical protein B0H16DRAFT_518498 [Mycena metata]|uniref:Uncharacterized protein n=1 Tax=Mycena metata TaxID=1033252 RepID=A0AAD7JHG8_9AGAR|nr:hypothetical protein B0H16DRAFT_518498 [Mycena metata]
MAYTAVRFLFKRATGQACARTSHSGGGLIVFKTIAALPLHGLLSDTARSEVFSTFVTSCSKIRFVSLACAPLGILVSGPFLEILLISLTAFFIYHRAVAIHGVDRSRTPHLQDATGSLRGRGPMY